jgi:hypothetical protein
MLPGKNLFPGKILDQVGSRCHSLIEAVQIAFSQHRPLLLSPDSIWLAIAQGFSHHLTANAEVLRDRVVRCQGKQELTEDFTALNEESVKAAIAGFSAQIRAASDPTLHSTLICDFSTTTPDIRTASEVVLMDTYSSYFRYRMRCVCGIPSITVTGCAADWERIRERVEVLASYQLDWWVERLRLILDEFVHTTQGRPNRDFWQAIYKPKKTYATESVTGWITDLFPYLGDPPERKRSHAFAGVRENWVLVSSTPQNILGIGTNAFPSGLSSAPLQIKFPDGSIREVDLVAGFFGVEQNPEDLALAPVISWCLAAVSLRKHQSLSTGAEASGHGAGSYANHSRQP